MVSPKFAVLNRRLETQAEFLRYSLETKIPSSSRSLSICSYSLQWIGRGWYGLNCVLPKCICLSPNCKTGQCLLSLSVPLGGLKCLAPFASRTAATPSWQLEPVPMPRARAPLESSSPFQLLDLWLTCFFLGIEVVMKLHRLEKHWAESHWNCFFFSSYLIWRKQRPKCCSGRFIK